MLRATPTLLPIASLLTVLLAAACSDSHAAGSEPIAAQRPVVLPEDVSLEPWRMELIELAMDAACALPVYPHLKNRSLAQESVVEACIALEQPRRAFDYSASIGNWRRGVGHAALALHLAERGVSEGLDELVALAEKESRLEGEENPQDWQRDLIRSKLAAALLKLGRVGDALPFENDLEDAEVGRVAAAKAALLDRDELEARLGELDALLTTATLDQLRSAMQAAIELYERGYDEPSLRERCDGWIARATLKVPAQLRLEVRLELSRRAAARSDAEEARSQVAQARAVLDGVRWLPEDRVPLTARVAAVRFAAGDIETARKELTEAVEAFHAGREQIQDFWRAAALRPVAEAAVALGDPAQALKLYRIAVEESSSNPNARPRCEDLVANCLSMARHGVQPDAEFFARLRKLREGLGDPW